MVVSLPSRLTVDSTVRFLSQFEAACYFHKGKVTIDCNGLGHVEPFSMILLANGIRKIRKENKSTIHFSMRGPFPSYPRFMGLFKSCGFQVDYDPNYSKGSRRYQQISTLTRSEITNRSSDNWSHPIDEIQKEAAGIARVLGQSEKSELFRILKYMLTEIMRNWYEHSEGSFLLTCAQYWPNRDRVECGVLDSGIGLRASLAKNANLVIISDRDAIDTAMLPGVSGKNLKTRTSDPWFNSGYGLYMISQLCKVAGEFLLMSGNSCAVVGKSAKRYTSCDLSGTGVRMIMRPSAYKSLEESLEEIRANEKKMGRTIVRSPSTYSRILSEEDDDN